MEAAVTALNEGKSFAHICFILSKLPIYKKALPAGATKEFSVLEFAMPAPKQVLGKRIPQMNQDNSIVAFCKRRNIKLKEGQDLPENWIELEREWETEQNEREVV